MYYMGEGVPQNNLRAYVWFSVAAAQGNEDARDFRDGAADEILTPLTTRTRTRHCYKMF